MRKPMSDEHKAALEVGRRQGRIVRQYLEALNKKPGRGRGQSEDSLRKRLDKINKRLESATPIEEVQLIQSKMDLEEKLENFDKSEDLSSLEEDFKRVVIPYSVRKRITRNAWRKVGVPASVLKDAERLEHEASLPR